MTTQLNLQQAYSTLANQLRPILEEDSGQHLNCPHCGKRIVPRRQVPIDDEGEDDWDSIPNELIATARHDLDCPITKKQAELGILTTVDFLQMAVKLQHDNVGLRSKVNELERKARQLTWHQVARLILEQPDEEAFVHDSEYGTLPVVGYEDGYLVTE